LKDDLETDCRLLPAVNHSRLLESLYWLYAVSIPLHPFIILHYLNKVCQFSQAVISHHS
jgi:hypothetical protein